MHNLKIGKDRKIKLDDFEIKNVEEYTLKSSANNVTELTLRIIVKSTEIET